MMDVEDYVMFETCHECKHRQAKVLMIYTRYENEALCKICYQYLKYFIFCLNFNSYISRT